MTNQEKNITISKRYKTLFSCKQCLYAQNSWLFWLTVIIHKQTTKTNLNNKFIFYINNFYAIDTIVKKNCIIFPVPYFYWTWSKFKYHTSLVPDGFLLAPVIWRKSRERALADKGGKMSCAWAEKPSGLNVHIEVAETQASPPLFLE